MSKSNRSRKSDHCRSGTSHASKSKKKNALGEWKEGRVAEWQKDSRNSESDLVPEDAIYGHTYQQQPVGMMPQTLPFQNGQRLFAAISDPSVCNYPTMPVTYAMEPMSLPPMYRLYQPPVTPSYPNYRPSRTGCWRNSSPNHAASLHLHVPPVDGFLTNGSASLRKNSSCQMTASSIYQRLSGDYASLPPTANMDNKINKEELSSEHRRYSDPGLGPADMQSDNKSEDSESRDSDSSITTISQSNKLLLTLVDQMTVMKETNNQLFKELHRTKEDLQNVKAELNRLKQYTSTGYQPGMLSNIIREIREASRIREDAVTERLKSMLDETQSSKLTDFEYFNIQLENLSGNKTESDRRIAKLEEELAAIKLSTSNGNQREIAAFEEENLSLRRELQEALASKSIAEKQSSKCVSKKQLEKLVKILREEVNTDIAKEEKKWVRKAESRSRSIASGSTISNNEERICIKSFAGNNILKEEDEAEDKDVDGKVFSDESDFFTDDSDISPKSNSTNNGNNSLSGPVTDL